MTGADASRLDRRDAVAIGLLFAFALAQYYPLVFMGRAVVDYDAFVYFYPQRAYLAQSLLEGRLPVWNPYLFMGAPFLANPQAAVLYPPSWLFALGPVHAVYSAQLVLHAFAAAAFSYLLGRMALGLHPLGAGVGALAYGFSGFIVGQAGHLNQLSAAAWLPAIVLTFDRAARLASPRWAGLCGLSLGLQVLAGHPQESFMSLVALALYALVRAPWSRPLPLAWCAAMGVCAAIVAALVAAPQVLATLELAPLSIRAAGVRWEDAVAGSLPSYLVPRALFPPYWLDVASTEYLGYIGVVPLTLGFLAAVVARGRGVLFGSLLCLLALFLAPGENNGNYWLFFEYIPGFDTFRVPARWLFLWTFGASVLAALGADWVARGARVGLRHGRELWPRSGLVALVLATGLAWHFDAGEEFPNRRTPAAYFALAGAALGAGALSAAGWRRPGAVALASLAAVELWAAADWSPARQAPPAELLSATPLALQTASQEPGGAGRLLSVAQPTYIPADEGEARMRLGGMPPRVAESLLVANKWRETLAPNIPLQYRAASVDGYDGGALPLLSFLRFSELLMPHGKEARTDGVLVTRIDRPPDSRLLDLAGVRWVLANREPLSAADAEVTSAGDLQLRERAAGRGAHSLLVFGAEVQGDERALQRMGDTSFDSNREVLIQPAPGAKLLASSVDGIPLAPLIWRPETWRARVSVPAPAYLLQREAWYPGWKARVDGLQATVFRANVLFRAVYLEPGEHDVELYFESTPVTRGLGLMLVGLALVAGLLAWPWWRERSGLYIIAERARFD